MASPTNTVKMSLKSEHKNKKLHDINQKIHVFNINNNQMDEKENLQYDF